MLAVSVATQVVVPLVLTVLSLFFARRALGAAAETVRDAGHRAVDAMDRVRRATCGRRRVVEPAPVRVPGEDGGTRGARVAAEDPRVRVEGEAQEEHRGRRSGRPGPAVPRNVKCSRAMHAAPAGFTFLPERSAPAAGRVFDVAREGRVLVCKRLSASARATRAGCASACRAEGALLRLLGGQRRAPARRRGRGRGRAVDRDGARREGATLAERGRRRGPAWLSRATEATFRRAAAMHDAGRRPRRREPRQRARHRRRRGRDAGRLRPRARPRMPPLPPGPFRGTLVYAAPEVARGEPFDGRGRPLRLAASCSTSWSAASPRAPS